MQKYDSKQNKRTATQQNAAQQNAAQQINANRGMPMSAMRSLLMEKAMEDKSHRIELREAMRAKMERTFGMNFNKVNLYESQSVADAGANAIARGGSIAFAPGKHDFDSLDGQRRLGHELSHIAAQARGEVTGSGFLDNGALEARADREGALAASGGQVYSGPMTDAPSFSASAPMQAEDNGEWQVPEDPGPEPKPPVKPDDYDESPKNDSIKGIGHNAEASNAVWLRGPYKEWAERKGKYDDDLEAYEKEYQAWQVKKQRYDEYMQMVNAQNAQKKQEKEEERREKLREQKELKKKINAVKKDQDDLNGKPPKVSFGFQRQLAKAAKLRGEVYSDIEKNERDKFKLRTGEGPTVKQHKPLTKKEQDLINRLSQSKKK